jgi:hypothetical protein
LFVINAPSGILSSQTTTATCWPIPAGFGETLMKANVGICHAGVCASALGIRTTKVLEINSRQTKIVAKFLFFNIFSLPNFILFTLLEDLLIVSVK